MSNAPSSFARFGRRRATASVALDIGSDAIVALAPAGAGRAPRPIVYPLPVGLVVDGEVVDSGGLADELRSLFQEHRLPRDVRVGLAHPRLMVRLVSLPASLDGTDLDNAVRHLATDLLPVGLNQLVIDYRRAGRVPGAGVNGPQQRILMAAARIDSLDRLMHALDEAGLRAQGISLSGLAMVSALAHPAIPGEAILYVQAGALTNVVVTEDGEPLLVRAASAGSEAIAAGLAERAGIPHEIARAHLSTLGLGTGGQLGAAAPISAQLEANVERQVREGLRRIAAEVQSSRGVYAARPDAYPIGAVVLTGSMTTWPGVVEALESDLHLPVVVASRENWPQLDAAGVAPERLDVVIGLSQESGDHRPDLRPVADVEDRVRTPFAGIAQIACALLALLAVAVVYLVVVANQVSSGREQLSRIGTELVGVDRRSAALKSYDDFAKATTARRDAVMSVAQSRFNWDRALKQLAEVAPSGVWLTSVRGTLSPTTVVPGGTTNGPTSGLRGALAVPALELSGCARREGLVPEYIDRLQEMSGVIQVGFSRTERLEKDSAESAPAAGGGGGGDCRNGDPHVAMFALVAYFKSTSAQASVTAPAAASADTAAQTPAAAGTATQAPSADTAAQTPGAGTAPASGGQTADSSASTGGSR